MSPRTGRPPIDNPKTERITVRLDQESSAILKDYCIDEKIDKAEAIRRGIRSLKNKKDIR